MSTVQEPSTWSLLNPLGFHITVVYVVERTAQGTPKVHVPLEPQKVTCSKRIFADVINARISRLRPRTRVGPNSPRASS